MVTRIFQQTALLTELCRGKVFLLSIDVLKRLFLLFFRQVCFIVDRIVVTRRDGGQAQAEIKKSKLK